MDTLGSQILAVVKDTNQRVEALLRQIDFAALPSILLTSLESCDCLPPRTACLYFLRHPVHGVLYLGKAGDLRVRWLAQNPRGEERFALHQHHERCLEIGDVVLCWLPLDVVAQEIAETVAIRCFQPAWNVRKNKDGYLRSPGVPGPRSTYDPKEALVALRARLGAARSQCDLLAKSTKPRAAKERVAVEAEIQDLQDDIAQTLVEIEEEREHWEHLKAAMDRL